MFSLGSSQGGGGGGGHDRTDGTTNATDSDMQAHIQNISNSI